MLQNHQQFIHMKENNDGHYRITRGGLRNPQTTEQGITSLLPDEQFTSLHSGNEEHSKCVFHF